MAPGTDEGFSMTQLGRTGIDVFPLVLGGSTFGWTSDEATPH